MPAVADASGRFARLVESPGPISLPPDFISSPAFDWLTSQHLIVQGTDATSIACAVCRSVHTPERRSDGTFEIVCLDGPEPVRAEQLRRWQTDWPTLCATFNKALSPGEPVRTLVSSRLSRVAWVGKPDTGFPVWLVRGLSRSSEVHVLLSALSSDNRLERGIVITSWQLPDTFKLPASLAGLWLGHCFNPALETRSLDLTPIQLAGYRDHQPSPKKRGRPPKPGDPVKEFLDRVNTGKAHRTIGKEAGAIRALECRLFGDKALAFAPSTIQEEIKQPFNRWKEQGFPCPFDWP